MVHRDRSPVDRGAPPDIKAMARARHPQPMINKNAMPPPTCSRCWDSRHSASAYRPLNAANISATQPVKSSTTAKLCSPAFAAADHALRRRGLPTSRPRSGEKCNPVHPRCSCASELGQGTCSPPTNSQPSRWRYPMLALAFNPTPEIRKNVQPEGRQALPHGAASHSSQCPRFCLRYEAGALRMPETCSTAIVGTGWWRCTSSQRRSQPWRFGQLPGHGIGRLSGAQL